MWTCYTFTEDSHNTGNFMPLKPNAYDLGYSSLMRSSFFWITTSLTASLPNLAPRSKHSYHCNPFIMSRDALRILRVDYCRCTYEGKRCLTPSHPRGEQTSFCHHQSLWKKETPEGLSFAFPTNGKHRPLIYFLQGSKIYPDQSKKGKTAP